MDPKAKFETFDSFSAADHATRREYWMMTVEQRLTIPEQLRIQAYPDGQTALDFKEFLSLLHTHHVNCLLDPVVDDTVPTIAMTTHAWQARSESSKPSSK